MNTGAPGLLLPALLRIKPGSTIVAAPGWLPYRFALAFCRFRGNKCDDRDEPAFAGVAVFSSGRMKKAPIYAR